MIEIEVQGQRYQVDKLNALKQFHLSRRLGPLLVVAGVSLQALQEGMRVDMGDMVAMAGPVMEMLSRMTDDEANYIIFTCLSVVRRQQGDAWAPVLTPDGKAIMFADIEMPALIRLSLEVIKANLGNFLTGLGVELTSPAS